MRYNAELTTLLEEVEEARIALEMTEAVELPRIEDIQELWREWNNETKARVASFDDRGGDGPNRAGAQHLRLYDRLIEHVYIAYSFGWDIGKASSGVRPDDDKLRQMVVSLGQIPGWLDQSHPRRDRGRGRAFRSFSRSSSDHAAGKGQLNGLEPATSWVA